MKKLLFFGWFCAMAVTDSNGQAFYDWKIERKWILSGGIMASTYYGDLESDFNYTPSGGQLGLKFKTPVNRLFGRVELSVFTLEGTDIGTPNEFSRGASFESTNIELSGVAIYYLFPTSDPYYARPVFNPYVFGGIGFLYFNPKGEVDGEEQALQPLMLEGVDYSRLVGVFPFGLGATFRINYLFDISLEGGFRYTLTDYLDDVSKRGNPDSNDLYWIMGIKLEAYLPYDIFSKKGNKPRVKMFRKFKNTIYE